MKRFSFLPFFQFFFVISIGVESVDEDVEVNGVSVGNGTIVATCDADSDGVNVVCEVSDALVFGKLVVANGTIFVPAETSAVFFGILFGNFLKNFFFGLFALFFFPTVELLTLFFVHVVTDFGALKDSLIDILFVCDFLKA